MFTLAESGCQMSHSSYLMQKVTLHLFFSLSLVLSLHHQTCIICADSLFQHNGNGCLQQSAAATKNLHIAKTKRAQASTHPVHSQAQTHICAYKVCAWMCHFSYFGN